MGTSRDENKDGSGDGAGDGPTSNIIPSPNSNRGLSTPGKTKKTVNAFDFLMSANKSGSGKKRKRSSMAGSLRNPNTTTSRFVLCPVGCGKHILPHEMNKHIDMCLLQQIRREQEEKSRQQEQESQRLRLQQQELLEQSKLLLAEKNQSENLKENKETSSPEMAPISIEGTPLLEPGPTIFVDSSPESVAKDVDDSIEDDPPNQPTSPKNPEAKPAIDKNDETQNNAFAHMMKMSATAFSGQEASSPKLFERIHLREDGRVNLTCYNSEIHRSSSIEDAIAWSATIQVRGTKDGTSPPIDLLVTSSISSISNSGEPQRIRLVRRHSRLSVPVLKSILQKGIRRRKPLPSLRVASELADKSLGDLLRRLPIIILEDSTLHPGLPFLVWLMMAVSKDYQPPLSLLKKVLEIIFEMSSCRWQDSLPKKRVSNTNDEEENETLTLACLHKTTMSGFNNLEESEGNGKETVLNDNDLTVWSMLLRKEYGGMTCDIKMLQGYAELWHKRFHSTQGIPAGIKKRLEPKTPTSSTLSTTAISPSKTSSDPKASCEDQCLQDWYQVPIFIHEVASKHSAARIDRLFMSNLPTESSTLIQPNIQSSFIGLPSLSKLDLTHEGVDFHCSSVLESAILSDAQIVRECFVRLVNSNLQLPTSMQDRRSWLEGLLKSCMWTFGGGVNFRMPMVGNKVVDDKDRQLRDFYETLIRPRVDAFSKRYIEDRMSKG